MKVFSLLSLKRNLVDFNKHKDKQAFITLYGYVCGSAPHYTGVGYCLFVFGLTRASLQINELLHTFFLFVALLEQRPFHKYP